MRLAARKQVLKVRAPGPQRGTLGRGRSVGSRPADPPMQWRLDTFDSELDDVEAEISALVAELDRGARRP